MDFGTAISVCFKKYFDFTGRASRSEFWYFLLFAFLLLFGAGILLGIFMPNNQSLDGVVSLFIYLPLLVPMIAVTARRIHDFGMSGWMQCIFLPGYIVAEMMGYNAAGWIIYFGTTIVFAVYLSQKPNKKKNKFGAPPKK
jgi:uncharacterized membrane protein YhaH (DUF805 family)